MPRSSGVKKQIDTLTKAQAKNIVIRRTDNRVHTFSNVNGMLLGADHTKISIFKDIKKSYECRLSGSVAQGMNHGLAILPKKNCLQKEILFVETNTKKTKRLVKKNE